MKNKVDQFNVNLPHEYDRYKKLADAPFVVIVEEKSEFCKNDGSYVILVQYVETLTPRLDANTEHGIDILNMDDTDDRKTYSEIMDNYDVNKVVASFTQQHKTFMLAIHWVKHKPVINLKTYKEGL